MPESSARTGGILLHPTSLPGAHGIGELGSEARRCIDLIADMGLSWWQMLPVGPTGYGDSPYQSPSTFAGNPLLIDIEGLVTDGLLTVDEACDHPAFSRHRVDFDRVIHHRSRLLGLAARRFDDRASSEHRSGLASFVECHRPAWLEDFALFTAIKRSCGSAPWWEWDRDLRSRLPTALDAAKSALSADIRSVMIEQYLFEDRFTRLRHHARSRGVGLIGDLPIFVAHDSADVWAHPHLFHLDENGMPTVVAGVPPDYFSETGQRWGNPLYDWGRHRADGFSWWTARMARSMELFDLVRIDHFRGFSAAWHIPASEETAVNGAWIEGPGVDLFDAVALDLGPLPVIAEDLGVITAEVEALRDRLGFPGMKVLQFGFGTESTHAPERFRRNVVAYTGTHDNDTATGWWLDTHPDRIPEHEAARRVLGTNGIDFHWALITALFESVADTVIVPLQDVLGLDSTARMNTPGIEAGNWRWRFDWAAIDDVTVARMRTLALRTGRS